MAALALSWNRAFSEQVSRAEAVKSVGALSGLRAGPDLAFAIGAIPKKRNAESKIEKRRLISSVFFLLSFYRI